MDPVVVAGTLAAGVEFDPLVFSFAVALAVALALARAVVFASDGDEGDEDDEDDFAVEFVVLAAGADGVFGCAVDLALSAAAVLSALAAEVSGNFCSEFVLALLSVEVSWSGLELELELAAAAFGPVGDLALDGDEAEAEADEAFGPVGLRCVVVGIFCFFFLMCFAVVGFNFASGQTSLQQKEYRHGPQEICRETKI